MNEIIHPEFVGKGNNEYTYKIKFQGFDTECRINLQAKEYTLIITDEMAQHYGYQTAEDLLGSDEHLDAINLLKGERESYMGGAYLDSAFKVVCKSWRNPDNS